MLQELSDLPKAMEMVHDNWDSSQLTQCQKPVLPGNETGDQNPANLGQPPPK